MTRKIFLLMALGVWALGVDGASAASTGAGLSLRWEIDAHRYANPEDRGSTHALLRLHNGATALPAEGWALYFNCPSEVIPGALPSHLRAEHVTGTLYRIRPTEGFPGLAPAADLAIEIDHPEVVVKATRAPVGPYLVLASDPDHGIAIHDYQMLPPQSPQQMPRGVGGHPFGETAADRYEANARIADLPGERYAPVLPTPKSYRYSGGVLRLTHRPAIVAAAGLEPEREAVALLMQRLPVSTRVNPHVSLTVNPQLSAASAEAYELTVNADGIRIVGKGPAGVARGVSSLMQLVLNEGKDVVVPNLEIVDAPRFAFRGLHMDVARNFQRREVVFHVLDLMARHKLNTLHLHLTDDEGWRLAIPGLPELTEVGARRGHHSDALAMLPPAHGSGPDPEDAHGSGYYTAEDYQAILRYAAARRITVLPEIEMPGHARAAVIAMEARARRLAAQDPAAAQEFRLADPQDRSRYVSAQGFNDNVMNPALPSTYRFVSHVIRALAQMHRAAGVPLETIHLGGDELARGAWTDSPILSQWMQSQGLKDRSAVWDHFYVTLRRMAADEHLEVAGWEEIAAKRAQADGPLVPNETMLRPPVQAFVWNNLEGAEDLGLRLANAGFPTVLAPVSAYYLDMVNNLNPEEPGATWAPPVTLEAGFAFDPTDYARRMPGDASQRATLTETGAAQLLGLEGTLWSETMREPESIDYLMLPRMLALAERAWAPVPDWRAAPLPDNPAYATAWSLFMNQVSKRALRALDDAGLNTYRIAAPGLRVVDGTVLVNHENPGITLRYTVDGRDPTDTSPRVERPIPLTHPVRVAAFDRRGRRGWIAEVQP